MGARAEKWRTLVLLSVAEVFALSLWFSATAAIPAIRTEYALSDFQASLFSSAVSVGFVAGTLISALMALADRIHPRRFFAFAALTAAAANALILLAGPDSAATIALRFVTGMCMAGIYPVGMKIAVSWSKGDIGLLTGVMTGALTLGTASPHLFNALGGVDWRITMIVASLLAVAAAGLVQFIRLGPGYAELGGRRALRPEFALRAWRHLPTRYANFGYFGHMIELYAMWAWIGVFLFASLSFNPGGSQAGLLAGVATFVTVGAGALGCIFGGLIADRIGRTAMTAGAMTISGLCCLAVGLLFGGPPLWLLLLCVVWGITIVADSAQFSSSTMELATAESRGTMLTVQICVGFLLTLGTIHLVPVFVDWLGWRFAFAPFALGPAFGIWAMLRLRGHAESVRLAGGRR